jgi:hypothetical protein
MFRVVRGSVMWQQDMSRKKGTGTVPGCEGKTLPRKVPTRLLGTERRAVIWARAGGPCRMVRMQCIQAGEHTLYFGPKMRLARARMEEVLPVPGGP